MVNDPSWRPTKFVRRGGQLRASKNQSEVALGSRIMADCVAQFYDRVLPLYAHGRLIDLGCGKAPLYGSYSKFVQEVVRADWQKSYHDDAHVDLLIDLNRELPLSNSSFDTVILSDVLEHVFSPQLCWTEIARILSPGGYLIMNVPFLYWIHEEPHDFYRYTNHALDRFAHESGFKTVELSALGGAVEVLCDILGKLLSKSRIGMPLAAAIPIIYSAFRRTGLDARLINATSPKFPLGFGMILQKID